MIDETLNKIVENLLYVLPIIHKELLKIDPPDISGEIRLSRLQFGIMGSIYRDKQPISEIAKKFLIPKSQMSLLVNQLVNVGFAVRKKNEKDRRVTDIWLTEKGIATLKLNDAYIKSKFKKKLAYLSENEIEDLSSSLIRLRQFGSSLEKHE